MEIIGISGKAGVGKDWIFSEYLKPRGNYRWALADAFKITAIGRGEATYEEVFVTKPPHVRAALQKTGTEEGRLKYGEDVWCRTAQAWMEHLNKTWGVSRFAVTDIRFENEVKFVQNLGGKVYRIVAPSRYAINGMTDDNRVHPSETALDIFDGFDGYILNDVSMPWDLTDWVNTVLSGQDSFANDMRIIMARKEERAMVLAAQQRIDDMLAAQRLAAEFDAQEAA